MTEPAVGQRVQRVRVAPGVERIRHQLRVVDIAQRDAVLRQHHRVELDVEADLENAW